MKQIVRLWDGKTSINGVSAEKILESREDLKSALGDIFLVMQGQQVCEIQIGKTISSNYEMDEGLTIEEIAENYLLKKEEELQKQKQEQLNINEMQNKISILESENKELKEELSQIQVSLASLVSAINK